MRPSPDAPADRHWLNRERLRLYPPVFVVSFLVAALIWIATSTHLIDRHGNPLVADFINVWAASWLGLHGHAAQAYDIASLQAALRVAVPSKQLTYAWLYPPAYFLLVLPLALLPYIAAYCLFMLTTLGAYLSALRTVLRGPTAWWCLAAFPGMWFNLYNGQNGFLTAALAAAALTALPRRPLLGGVLVGLLTIKPQLALGFMPALLAIGAWGSLAAAAVTAIAFNALGVAVLGPGVLHASLANFDLARRLLENGVLPLDKMPSLFAALRLIGAPIQLAWMVHALGATAALLLLWRVWRHSADWSLRGAALMTATFLFSPYVFDYDLAWLAFPIAWLAAVGCRDGWRRGDREILLAAWLLPLLIALLCGVPHLALQPGPFVLGALLWAIARRVSQRGACPIEP